MFSVYIWPGGGCEFATIKRYCLAWGKFRELLPLLTCEAISLNICTTAVLAGWCFIHRNVGPSGKTTRNIWSIMKEQCSYGCVTSRKNNNVSIDSLLRPLKLKSLDSVLRCNRLHLFGHVKQSELYTGKILDLEVEGNWSCGLQKKWNLQDKTCQNCSEGRNQMKTASHTHWACIRRKWNRNSNTTAITVDEILLKVQRFQHLSSYQTSDGNIEVDLQNGIGKSLQYLTNYNQYGHLKVPPSKQSYICCVHLNLCK